MKCGCKVKTLIFCYVLLIKAIDALQKLKTLGNFFVSLCLCVFTSLCLCLCVYTYISWCNNGISRHILQLTQCSYHFQRSSGELTCKNCGTNTTEVLPKMFESKRVIRHCHYSDNAELKLFGESLSALVLLLTLLLVEMYCITPH